ncbi:Sec34-domain-containing protein [Cryphonectria parasitica EP155]|uniref:Conserved oligomeric Golgi complex subunit 3 n=1 Tax=Cryphonectria parasitica (strain ATCC 38755 / EP155) TaxID=660469 RepID=A0A9P5CM14_CRYP1|nr:Sec34-domain-containing protein [Cryphonectria parasitica EP155]KAF3763653.1 Sec34-domain-containing protein [Cryphonectria parasitica EP155]
MYEDSWYNYIPELQQQPPQPQHRKAPSQTYGHRRRESLLQQPIAVEDLEELIEEDDDDSPPEPGLSRRARSVSDFHDIVRAEQLAHETAKKKFNKKKSRAQRRDSSLDALALPGTEALLDGDDVLYDTLEDELLLDAGQQEYTLYGEQLAMTERHLETLIGDTNSALKLLASLSESFRGVEEQTSTFQSQCEGLLSEQRRLETLADEVGTDLHYYAYIDNVTRRLNAPGAGRQVEDESFGETLQNLDACIAFMGKNPSYRDSESYLARYQALLTKALHLLEVGLQSRLDRVSADISRQIAGTKSESARHALAYGRFEEMMLDSYSLIPNVQKVVHQAYDQSGNALSGTNSDIYSNTANNIFQAYIAARDRDLRPIIQHDLDIFKKEAKDASVETASRNYVKQCFERSFNEAMLFAKIFAVEPHYSTDPNSAFVTLKSHQRVMVNATNVVPIANSLQGALQTAKLQTICNILGWITNEYLISDYDDDESAFTRHCQELAARLLAEHLWVFTDSAFEAEIAKSISKVTVLPDALKIGPVVDGVASSNAYPPVKRALELLVMFDQSMPKERCQRNSPVVYKIVKETIQVLQRAEARIKTTKSGTDPDLFMLKNLLILKNELVSLEIGDVRNQESDMQYFGQIWNNLTPQNLVGYVSSFIPGAASLWSRSGANASAQTPQLGGGGPSDHQDASEQLDDLLRQAIGGFTLRWAELLGGEGGGRKTAGKNLVKVERELEEMLQNAFSNQPEVIGKLKEAIQMHQQVQAQKR